MDCFGAISKHEKEFDSICEEETECAPIPITRPMFHALQKTIHLQKSARLPKMIGKRLRT